MFNSAGKYPGQGYLSMMAMSPLYAIPIFFGYYYTQKSIFTREKLPTEKVLLLSQDFF